MDFYDAVKSMDMILDKKKEVFSVKYPGYQNVKILTVHLRRLLVPRQQNIRSGGEAKTYMKEEGVFNPSFKRKVFKRSAQAANVCTHCVVGAWAYVRVGEKTFTMWMKGEGKNIDFIQD
jgi:hypothetical protein